MFRAQIKVFDRFPEITAQVEQLARVAVDQAARTAAETAQAGASIDLELELIPAHGYVEGYAAGIRSNKKGQRGTRIAPFFDGGTLGGRKKALKGARRASWTVNRGGGSYTAHRGDIDGKGIKAERFFLKARLAGRRSMAAIVKRGL
jgi:hypothetical protein